jgi:chemotaxis protein histidine kinase CheA
MTGGLLDFFTLEASEYVEQLDGLVSRATATPPDADAFTRAIRALRGAATMAKLNPLAELAGGVERLAKKVREGALPWDSATRAVAIAAIDDVKILIHNVRGWSEADDARAQRGIAELERLAPKAIVTAPFRSGSAFLSSAAADAAAGLLEFAENPGTPAQFAQMMEKVRALRGVAALNDLPPMGEVVDAVDAAAKAIELGQEEATAERRRLFRTAARVLLEGGDAVRQGGKPPIDSPAVREFSLASSTLSGTGEGDDVVPIASLLMEGDSVEPATNPPTTAAQRFRLEVVSQAEHLRRLVHDGRHAADTATRERISRELRSAVRALARAAQSFGAVEIANLFLAAERTAAALDAATLDVLDSAALLLSASDAAPESIKPQFVTLSESLTGAAPPPRIATPITVATPKPMPSGTGSAAPSGAALRDLLATGLSGLAPLAETNLAAPVVGEEDDVIPIEDLLLRGRDALERAIQIGDALRHSGAVPDPATLSELYDLLQLAAAE